jgi:hypothetical protein
MIKWLRKIRKNLSFGAKRWAKNIFLITLAKEKNLRIFAPSFTPLFNSKAQQFRRFKI